MARPRKTAGASALASVAHDVITLPLNEWNAKGRDAVFDEHDIEAAHVSIDPNEGVVSIARTE